MHSEWTSKPIVTAIQRGRKRKGEPERARQNQQRDQLKHVYTYIYSKTQIVFRPMRNDKLYINLNLLIFMLNVVILIRLTDTVLFLCSFFVCVLSSSSLFPSAHIFISVVWYYLLFKKDQFAGADSQQFYWQLLWNSVQHICPMQIIQFKLRFVKAQKIGSNDTETEGITDRIGMLHKISSMVPLGTEM